MSSKEFLGRVAGGVPFPPLAYPIEDVPEVTGIPRTKVFEAVRNKQLTVRKAGRTTIVEHPELLRYVQSLPCKGREADSLDGTPPHLCSLPPKHSKHSNLTAETAIENRVDGDEAAQQSRRRSPQQSPRPPP
jgi:hypothetical protein